MRHDGLVTIEVAVACGEPLPLHAATVRRVVAWDT